MPNLNFQISSSKILINLKFQLTNPKQYSCLEFRKIVIYLGFWNLGFWNFVIIVAYLPPAFQNL